MDALTEQICASFHVILLTIRCVMLGAIQFNRKFCCSTVEIQNKSAAGHLPAKSIGITTQIFIPKFSFFLSHILSQFLCTGCEFSIMLHVSSLFRHGYAVPPSPEGKAV